MFRDYVPHGDHILNAGTIHRIDFPLSKWELLIRALGLAHKFTVHATNPPIRWPQFHVFFRCVSSMPFDVTKSPGYQISYFMCVLAAYSIASTSAIEAFTFSVSLFIRAAFNDLRMRLHHADSELYVIDSAFFDSRT